MHREQELVGEVAALRSRLAELEDRLAAVPVVPEPERSTRRGMLRLAGAAALGGAATALTGSRPAAASTGTMQYGDSNNSGSDYTTLTSSSTAFALEVTATNNNATAAIRGIGTQGAHGLYGRNDSLNALNAAGVWAGCQGDQGYAVIATGGKAQIWVTPGTGGPTAPGNYNEGALSYDSVTDALWVCVSATGSSSTWRKLGGRTTAGSLHVIPPARAYDSRQVSPGPKAVLATGANRLVSVANKYSLAGALQTANVVPAGATAIAYNVTVVNTVGTNGYVAVNDGGNTTVAASIINWTAAGQTIANSSVVKLNGSRQITVICGGTATSCNFIIDVLGYYL